MDQKSRLSDIAVDRHDFSSLTYLGIVGTPRIGHAALECAEGVSVPIERIDTDLPHVAIDEGLRRTWEWLVNG